MDSQKSKVYFYPNPTTSFIKSNFDGSIKIYNLSGELMFSKNLIYKGELIDLTFLESGVYHIKINNILPYKLIIFKN